MELMIALAVFAVLIVILLVFEKWSQQLEDEEPVPENY